jgi:dienelactone hydrolase
MSHTLSSGTPVLVEMPTDTPTRGIVILPDMGGLGPNFERIAADLAARHGAAVAVVELFPERQHLTFQERLDFGMREISEARVLADATEAAGLLGAGPVAVMGFCIGGALAMRAVTTGRFDRAVSWYGMVHMPPPWAGDKGDPLDAVAANDVPVLQIVGDADQFINASQLDELEAAGAGVVRVAGAQHGFAHDPGHANHDAAAASAMWSIATDFLDGTQRS